MKIELQPGMYVIAVSGGVDSMVLLDILRRRNDFELVIAHFDHGIRPDSRVDADLVLKTAKNVGVPFMIEHGRLGSGASEDTARKARYKFLKKVVQAHGADAIVTAHHQDDLIETALINTLRGTKRKGLTSLRSTQEIRRPMLAISKVDIYAYARSHGLEWHEDSTNSIDDYLRNVLRNRIKNTLNPTMKRQIMESLTDIDKQNQDIDSLLTELLPDKQGRGLSRSLLTRPGLAESYEITAQWLRNNEIEFDEQAIKRLVIGARTLRNGSQIDIKNDNYCLLTREKIILKHRESV